MSKVIEWSALPAKWLGDPYQKETRTWDQIERKEAYSSSHELLTITAERLEDLSWKSDVRAARRTRIRGHGSSRLPTNVPSSREQFRGVIGEAQHPINLLAIQKDGKLVVSRARFASPTGLRVGMFRRKYIAVSHTWSDRFWERPEVMEAIIGFAKGVGIQYIWLDVHCVSNNPTVRRRSLEIMGRIYEEASCVLVISRPSLHDGCITTAFSSEWGNRAWTFQEAYMASALAVLNMKGDTIIYKRRKELPSSVQSFAMVRKRLTTLGAAHLLLAGRQLSVESDFQYVISGLMIPPSKRLWLWGHKKTWGMLKAFPACVVLFAIIGIVLALLLKAPGLLGVTITGMIPLGMALAFYLLAAILGGVADFLRDPVHTQWQEYNAIGASVQRADTICLRLDPWTSGPQGTSWMPAPAPISITAATAAANTSVIELYWHSSYGITIYGALEEHCNGICSLIFNHHNQKFIMPVQKFDDQGMQWQIWHHVRRTGKAMAINGSLSPTSQSYTVS
ncbi:hypothetical protein Unana1_02382 [Umbelopsis nana]